ncbi:MAG TPA: T9SS type A sorting domain-containing protein [Candidatus Kapabacteria bacterium]|nr:T9SS type A sorting domain-containing protein [Candidatus Kapabacteria bacterium]
MVTNLRRRVPASLLLFLLLTLGAHAQGTRGTDFWGGFIYNVVGGQLPQLQVFVVSHINTTGTISNPLSGWSQNFGVPANTGIVLTIPAPLFMSFGSEGAENKAFHITTFDSVEVYCMNYLPAELDASFLLPTAALGKSYRVLSYSGTVSPTGPLPSQFQIVATQDGTNIEITPAATTLAGHPAGTPFSIALDAGQVYQVQSESDLTGSLVRALNDKSFAVFAGVVQTVVPPTATQFADHLYEELYPMERWGTYFVALPLLTRGRDLYRVMAGADNTTVAVQGMPPFVLNAGEFREFDLSQPTVIQSSDAVEIAQYSYSGQVDFNSYSDPAVQMINPVDHVSHDLIFESFPEGAITDHYVNLLTLNASLDQVMLDGSPIGAQFVPVPGDPFYAYARLHVGAGAHHVTSYWGVNAGVYGFGSASAYSYAAGAENLRPCATPVIRALGDTVFCKGGSVGLDAGPGFKSYQWSSGQGTQSIVADSSGTYAVITVDSSGCQRLSRPVHVTVNPLPSAAIAVAPDSVICPCDSAVLTAPPGLKYTWSTGSAAQRIAVRTAGTYSLSVADTFGCIAASSVTIAIDDATPIVALGGGSAAPSEHLRIPLHVVNRGDIENCGLVDYTVTVRFNKTLLHLENVNGAAVTGNTVDSTSRTLTISGVRGGDTLAMLEFSAALGDAESTPITIESFQWTKCSAVHTDTAGGTFTLLGICTDGGPRLLEVRSASGLKSIAPNPAGDDVTIDCQIIEPGSVDLYLADAAGHRVITLLRRTVAPGPLSVGLNTLRLASGVYYCVLETPSQRFVRQLHVVR